MRTQNYFESFNKMIDHIFIFLNLQRTLRFLTEENTDGLAILNSYNDNGKILDRNIRNRLCRLIIRREFDKGFHGLRQSEKLAKFT